MAKKCDKCGNLYDRYPYDCILGNGERADSTIKIHGDVYNLCPKCTYEVWQLLHKVEPVDRKDFKVVK